MALIIWAHSAHAEPPITDPPTHWVWVKHPHEITWMLFAPANDYDDCVARMLPKVAHIFREYSSWTMPRFKCETHKHHREHGSW